MTFYAEYPVVGGGSGGSGITSLTGDVTATGPGAAAATIANNAVTNSKLAQMPANTIKGNNTGSTANAKDLTVAQSRALLGVVTTFFVFKPQATTPSGNVYNNWATLYADLILSSGYRQIDFDGTDDAGGNLTNISIPAGTYDMTGVVFNGLTAGNGNIPTVIAADGCVLNKFTTIGDNINVGTVSNSPVTTVGSGVINNITIGSQAVLFSNGTAPFFSFTDTFCILLLNSSATLNSSDTIDLQNSSLIVYLNAASIATSVAISGDVLSAVFVYYAVASGSFDLNQPDFAGTISVFLPELAANLFFDDTVTQLDGASTVQTAIETLQQRAVTTVINQSIAGSNIGTGETDLATVTNRTAIPMFDDDLEIIVDLEFAANVNSKRVKVYIDGNVIYDTGALVLNTGRLRINGHCINNSNTDVTSFVMGISTNAALGIQNQRVAHVTGAWTSDFIVKVTGQGGASADIIAELFVVRKSSFIII